MEIFKAKNIGFCFGVKRAINKANQLLKETTNDNIYMLGEIIHNPQVIIEFESKGVHIVQDVSQVPFHKYLITRAHGISHHERQLAKKRDIKLIDTTCPYVKKLHQITDLLRKENYQIIIFGDTNHPEIKSLLSYNNVNAKVFQSINDIKDYSFSDKSKIGLISQTTKDKEEFKQIISKIFENLEELRIFNTICKATSLRQNSTRKLAKKVDLMIVVGGLNSANTTRLAQLSKKIGVDTYHIETAQEIKKTWFKKKNKIGITSGASTPDYITESVINRIKKIFQMNQYISYL
ncbi:MAG: 4-hydroxy-3-methylbut-2-enyl diphosphate reductase [bacterium]